MTISSSTRKAGPFTGTGVVSTFPFTFKVFQASDLLVVRLNSSTSIESTLVLNTDYTVSLNTNQNTNPGGSVVLTSALASGFTLTITSDIGNLQPTDLTNQGGFYPTVINDALDRATIQIQQLAERIGRALGLSVSTPDGTSLTVPTPSASTVIGWNEAGDGLQNYPLASGTAVAAYVSEKFTATAGQTVFTLANAYQPAGNTLSVYVNGLLVSLTTDYLETTANTVTFNSGLTVGDEVVCQVWRTNIATSGDAVNTSYTPAGTGAVPTTVQEKLRESVSVKDFGAVGDGVADDTAAFTLALAASDSVFVPKGTYVTSGTISIGFGQRLIGEGQYITTIRYSGAGTAVYMGSPVLTSLIYNCELHDLTVSCTNRGSSVVGVELQNCVYFDVSNLSIFGSGSPNSAVPAERVLYGYGLYLHDNSIIGHVSHVSCRLWSYGKYYATDASSQSRWTAAIVDDGQGEVANCMRGIVVGDPTIALYSGVGVTFRDLSIQGCYTTGINIYSGDGTVVENCYFEGNANYDIAVGGPSGSPSPIGVKILNNSMNSEDIGTTPYGTFPYLAKVYIDRGNFTTIRDNNISISTSIPLISLAAGSDSANISGNRLNSAIATTSRISNSSTTTITADNYPEAPRVAIGTITRVLSAASNSVAYTGLGFKPTSIEFTGSVDTVNERFIGFAGLTGSGILNKCLTTDGSGANTTSSNCIKLIRSTASDYVTAVVASFDSDGFTLTWTKTGSPPANNLLVSYIARR